MSVKLAYVAKKRFYQHIIATWGSRSFFIAVLFFSTMEILRRKASQDIYSSHFEKKRNWIIDHKLLE